MPKYNLNAGGRYEGPIRGFVVGTGGGWTEMCSERPFLDRGQMTARGDTWSVPDFAWEEEPKEVPPYEIGTLFRGVKFPEDEFHPIWRLEWDPRHERAVLWHRLDNGQKLYEEPQGLTRLYREDEV